MVFLPWCRDMMQAIKRFSGNTRLKLNAVNTSAWVACCPHPVLNMQLWKLIIICNVRVAPSWPTSRSFSADAVKTPIACSGAGPRNLHNADASICDTHWRHIIRNAIGVPSAIC